MHEHRLNYGQGAQTIRTVAVSSLGFAVRPSAATMQLVDQRYGDNDANRIVAAAAPATLDPVDTTTTADTGRGSADSSLVTLSTVASIEVGRRYLLASASGPGEEVTVISVNATAKTVRLLTPPKAPSGYATGATFKGLEWSATVAAPVADTDTYFDARLAAIWTFTAVTPARVIERVELVRPRPSWATLADVLRLEPGLSGRSAELETCLAMAHDDLETDLRMAGLNPYTFDPGPLGRQAVMYLAAFHALKDHENDAAQERAKMYFARYTQIVTNLTVGRDKAGVTEVDAASGAAEPIDTRSLFVTLW